MLNNCSIFLIFLVCGCSQIQPKQIYATPPEILMQPPQELQLLNLSNSPRNPNEVSSTVKLSTVINTVTENYSSYHQVAEQLKALQNWIKQQRDLNNG